MGKKSKRNSRNKQSSLRNDGVDKENEAFKRKISKNDDDKTTDENKAYDDNIANIKREHRELCPEAQDFYPVTRELFDTEIWPEIQTYWLYPSSPSPSKEIAWELVKDLQLDSLKSQPILQDVVETSENLENAQELELLYSMPFQFPDPDLAYKVPQRHYKYWSIRWVDLVPGFYSTISGSILCQPFFEDPPMNQPNDQYHEECRKNRLGWNLRKSRDFEPSLECFRLGAGLTANDLSFEDMARCMIPAIGILVRQHPANQGNVLRRTMLRFERQVRTWNPGDTSDPKKWETSENVHRRAGILTSPNIIADLKRENRWHKDPPKVEFPEGAQVCQYRLGDGVQHRAYKLANGRKFTVPTRAKKGNGESQRTLMSSLIALAIHNGLSQEEALKKVTDALGKHQE